MSAPAISVENVSKRYIIGHQRDRKDGLRHALENAFRSPAQWLRTRRAERKISSEDFWALRDVSFEVKPGEVVGIIGRNGAGKSTLLKILSRITEPTSGRIRIRGRVASLLEVGTGFHPELTGRENIFLNGAILGMSRAEIKRKFDEIVAFAEIERFLDTPVKRYSSGMYVRLAFAVAAHLEPEVLIIDEVLAVGDIEFQKKCLGKMSQVAKAGRTVLFVSHNTIALRRLCERGIVMDGGILRSDGEISDALNFYASTFGAAPTQSWARTADGSPDNIVFEAISGILNGIQPALTLSCDITLRCGAPCAASFIAVDICDGVSSPLMQAVPDSEPFIKGVPGVTRFQVEVDLPALIPGRYEVGFWIGSHYTATLDYVPRALVFEINESPTPGRSFPHSSDCGYIVPVARYNLISSPVDERLVRPL